VRAYLARRVAQGVVVIALVVTATFALIRLAPGDPFASTLDGPSVPQDVRDAWRARYGFDRPIPEQYRRYLVNIARGDFGYSTSQKRPVRDAVATALPRTLLLMIVAITARPARSAI